MESISELMDPLEEDDDIKKLKESLKDLHHRQSKDSSKVCASLHCVNLICVVTQNCCRMWAHRIG